MGLGGWGVEFGEGVGVGGFVVVVVLGWGCVGIGGVWFGWGVWEGCG